MRAAVFTEYGEPLDVREVDEPDLDPKGVIVETEACGICRSDWHAWYGDWAYRGWEYEEGHIFGHEPGGRRYSAGSTSSKTRTKFPCRMRSASSRSNPRSSSAGARPATAASSASPSAGATSIMYSRSAADM